MARARKPARYVWVQYTADGYTTDYTITSKPTTADLQWLDEGDYFVRYEISPEPKKGGKK